MRNSPEQPSWWSKFDCIVCGSKAIGINFGARTCAPCKGKLRHGKETLSLEALLLLLAFFRRNARRREVRPLI